jgi:cell fate regulator YaaT (PSP1 superfamily)
MCGRLRCCLIYEYENYLEARKTLPKKNKRVITPNGEGKVIDVYPLRGAVLVEIPEIGKKEFNHTEIQAADEQEVLNQAAASFVAKHGSSGCEQCKRK